MNCNSINVFFQNFANKANLDIILALRNGPKNVKTLCECVCCEQSAVSHNLKNLCNCNIISGETKGRERIYSLNSDTVVPLLQLVETHVKKHCCSGCTKK
ncbi:MAG: metalloregulator ArsR/SmtB family transcription factor [Candidatus Undinarchaeales archaeon]|jgi:predicted transcriptional regulator|nr:metalloregulator ArsR/SmtB family transcription factor [Candidatus Undinarchaeales archaeon]